MHMTMMSTLKILIIFSLFVITKASEGNQRPGKAAVIPGGHIVQFHPLFSKEYTGNHFEEFYRQVEGHGVIAHPRLNLTSAHFFGVSFVLADPNSLAAINELASVGNTWPIHLFSTAGAHTDVVFDINGNPMQSINYTDLTSYPPHIMTGVDKLHQMGYYGQNVTIAIIDSGIDYTHPDLGGGFGPGYKVSFGYDLVGDAYDGTNTPQPDNDPFSSCGPHGTHVAGIIGAQGRLFTGVAPNATLGMYRVFGCQGSASSDVLISAYIMAEASGAQIITASIGGPSGWPQDAWSVVVDRIARSGVTCLVAAGNDGTAGVFYGDTAAGAPAAIAVASSNTIGIPLLTLGAEYKIGNQTIAFNYSGSLRKFTTSVSGYPLASVNISSINTTDACSPLQGNLVDLSFEILLIKYGQCDWKTQYLNLYLANANYVMFFGNPDFSIIGQQTLSAISYGFVENSVAQAWITALRQHKSIQMYFPVTSPSDITYQPNVYSGGLLSYFTSWYPMNDLSFKPDVTAPGGYIFSTFPVALGSYAIESGTSMATPYAAGVAALYLSARGFSEGISAAQLKNIILNTATPMKYAYNYANYSYLAPTAQQGVGFINALALLKSTTRLNLSTVALNDTANFKKMITFTIKNTGNTTVNYILSNIGAGTFNTFQQLQSGTMGFGDLSTLVQRYATVVLTPARVRLNPRASATITARFTAPSNMNGQILPIYSGFIRVSGDNQEIQNIGYLGAVGSIKNLNLNKNLNVNTQLVYYDEITGNSGTVKPNQKVNFTMYSLAILTMATMGTPLMRVDIVGTGASTTVGGVSIVGSVFGYPQMWQPRMIDSSAVLTGWNGTLSSGRILRSGRYNILLRFLKIFGNQNNANDYYTWRSPLFIVV